VKFESKNLRSFDQKNVISLNSITCSGSMGVISAISKKKKHPF